MRWKRLPILFVPLMLAACATGLQGQEDTPAPARPTSVVLFISDGASFETWNLAGYWARGQRDGAPWSDWPVRLGMTTFSLNTSTTPTMNDTPEVGYDPILAWSPEPVPPDETPFPPVMPGAPAMVYPAPFAGYQWVRRDVPDSASGGTTLATGLKTFNNAIATDNFGQNLTSVTEDAKRAGLSTGVVTSVPFSHATPAVFGSNSIWRDDYHGIAHQMIFGNRLDVIVGAGNPDYDHDGRKRETPDFSWVGQQDWAALLAGETPRVIFQSAAEIEALADGRMPSPDRWIAVPKVGATLQLLRSAAVAGTDSTNPSGIAFTRILPDLATLSRAALNRLGQDPDGFFLMIEGGAVDWAAHANKTGLLIEEQLDFEAAVAATVDWLRDSGRLDSTLLIVATDHGNGLPLGTDSDTVAWQPVKNRGKGKLPEVRWHTNNHTNENTRLWATGPGSECLSSFIVGVDPGLRDIVGHNADGHYIDNTAIAPVIRAAIEQRPCPVPAD
jgi:alkaline phosphatase